MSLRAYLWRQDIIFALLLVASALGHWGLGYVGGATVVRPIPLARQQGRTTVAIELVAPVELPREETLSPLPSWEEDIVPLDDSVMQTPLVPIRQGLFTSRDSVRETERVQQRRNVEPRLRVQPDTVRSMQRLPSHSQEQPRLERQVDRLSRRALQQDVQVVSRVPIEKLPAEATQTVLRKGSTGVPVPPQLRSRPDPVHPRELLRKGVEGSVQLQVRVAVDGKVTDVKVNRSSGYAAMDRSAVDAVQRWEFAPGRRNGQPAAMTVIVPIEFRIIRR